MQSQVDTAHQSAGSLLRISLWVAQALMFAAFVLFGLMKLFMAPEALVAMWGSSWPLDHPMLLRFTGVVDAAGGLGILLPAVTRIQPRLGILAALGIVVLQIAAIAFHMSRGEFVGLPLNIVLLALASFILWGRSRRAPILPRT